MHGDLSPNLHTPECNLLITEFKKCHAENPLGKFFGSCNNIDNVMTRCLKNERKTKQSENLRKSAERRKQFEERVARDRIDSNRQ